MSEADADATSMRTRRILAAMLVIALSIAAFGESAAANNNNKPNTHQGNPKSKSQARG